MCYSLKIADIFNKDTEYFSLLIFTNIVKGEIKILTDNR